MAPIKIAVVVHAFPSVSETFITSKVMHLAKRGHQVNVYCNKKNAALYQQLFYETDRVTIQLFDKKTLVQTFIKNPFVFFSARRKGGLFLWLKAALINKLQADIVHFEFSGIGIQFLPVFSILTGKKIFSCRGSGEKVKLLTEESRQQKMRLLCDAADAVHCVSDDMKETILPYCSQPFKIFVNRPSIDTVFFKRTNEHPAHGNPVILSVGRLTFQKGYFTGLMAMRLLAKENANFKWIIAGSGPQQEEIVFHIHQMGLKDKVVLAGNCTAAEIKALMQTASIYFLPSVYEGIANSVLEAMSMELPVTATRSGGMAEVITNLEDGLLANVYDAETLAAHLLKLLSDESLRKNMAVAARQKVVTAFDIERQVSLFEKVYHQLLQTGTVS